MKNQDKSQFFQEWINKAQEDEEASRILLKEGGGIPATVCFLSQQMAEKYLKAFLVFHKKEFPKIHQLERLLGLCKEIDADFKDLNEESVLLSEYYIETRYPGDLPEPFSIEDAKEAFEAAETIKDFVLRRVK